MKITPNTAQVALIGHPVAHSLSPQLHNTIYQNLGIDMIYTAYDVTDKYFKDAVLGMSSLNFLGFNVTIPYKVEIMKYLDEIDPLALAIGAVNTIRIDQHRLVGYNTDGLGFLGSLKEHNISCGGKDILILGAGGSARAIGISIVGENPNSIFILNRNKAKGQSLVRDINQFASRNLSFSLDKLNQKVDIIINTTPLGMWPNTAENALGDYIANPDTIVCDIVYNPLETTMLREAKKAGSKTLGGIGMLVGQAIKSIEIWTNRKIPSSAIDLASKKLVEDMNPKRKKD